MLVKCGTVRRVAHDDIRRGLDWVLRNRKRFGIRIVNVSCGGDYEASYLNDGLSQAAERATSEGLLVCCRRGQLGRRAGSPGPAAGLGAFGAHRRWPRRQEPAWPSAGYDMYHSSYGPTLDGLQKPEVIAPGIWVAAPILPGTPTAAQADLLTRLAAAPDVRAGPAPRRLRRCRCRSRRRARRSPPPLLRELIAAKLRDNNVISGAYKHVDGTSFAAPIVASLAAQMLEANPELTPARDQADPDPHGAPARAHRDRSPGLGRRGPAGRRARGRALGKDGPTA